MALVSLEKTCVLRLMSSLSALDNSYMNEPISMQEFWQFASSFLNLCSFANQACSSHYIFVLQKHRVELLIKQNCTCIYVVVQIFFWLMFFKPVHFFLNHRRVPIVATLVTFGISSLWGSLLSGGRYFRGVVTFGEQKSFTNKAGTSFFSEIKNEQHFICIPYV